MGGVLRGLFRLDLWACIGFTGQILFTARFLVQWIASERKRESVVPVAFWYFSIGGGLISLVYAIAIRSLPFALGQGCGLAVYARNLWLIHRKRASGPTPD